MLLDLCKVCGVFIITCSQSRAHCCRTVLAVVLLRRTVDVVEWNHWNGVDAEQTHIQYLNSLGACHADWVDTTKDGTSFLEIGGMTSFDKQ